MEARQYRAIGLVFAGLGIILTAIMQFDMATLLKEVMVGLGITSISAAGVISTFPLLASGVSSTIFGRLSDVIGRRVLMAIGLATLAVFTLLTAVARSDAAMVTVRLCLGIGQGIFLPTYFAYLGTTFAKHRGLVVGMFGGLFTVGTGLNPMITQQIYLGFGHTWQAPFIAYGLFSLLLALGVLLAKRTYDGERDARQRQGGRAPAIDWQTLLGRNMIFVTIAMIFWGLTNLGFIGTYTLFLRLQHYTLGQAVIVTSASGWFAYVMCIISGYVGDRIGRRNALIILALVAALCGYPAYLATHSFIGTLVLACLFQGFSGGFFTTCTAYAQDLAGAGHAGAHSGAVLGFAHIMAGFSGLIVGLFASMGGFGAVGGLMALGNVVMLVCILGTRVHFPRMAATAPPLAPES